MIPNKTVNGIAVLNNSRFFPDSVKSISNNVPIPPAELDVPIKRNLDKNLTIDRILINLYILLSY